MQKTLFIALFSALFLWAGTGMVIAHCGNCSGNHAKPKQECTHKHDGEKLCVKCEHGSKVCERCEDKMKKKPCKVCEESERRYYMNKRTAPGEIFFNE
jgi:hypothetical protein